MQIIFELIQSLIGSKGALVYLVLAVIGGFWRALHPFVWWRKKL